MARVLGVFIERLVSGLKAKLEGKYGGVLVQFRRVVLGEAKLSKPMEYWCPVIQAVAEQFD